MRERARRQRERLFDPRTQQRAGTIMIVTAVIGVIVAVAGTIVVWRLIGTIDRAATSTLDVTIESLGTVEDTIEVADGTVASTSATLTELETTLRTLSESLDAGGEVVDDAGELSATAGPTLRNATDTFRQLESVGSGIDTVLAQLAALPFGPDFAPENGLGPTLGQVADDLEPLPDRFDETAASLTAFETTLGQLQTDVDALAETVGGVSEQLATSDELLAGYRQDVAEARAVAESSRADLNRDRTLLRILIALGALNFAVAQIVPLWLGAELVERGRRLAGDT